MPYWHNKSALGVALLSLLGFVWLFVALRHDGQVTRKEALAFLPYDEKAEDPFLSQGPSDISLFGSERPDGTYWHTITLQTDDYAIWDKLERVGLEILSRGAPASIKSAKLIFNDGQVGNELAAFEAGASSLPAQVTKFFLIRAASMGEAAMVQGGGSAVLEFITTAPAELSLRVQLTQNKPLSSQLWFSLDGNGGDAVHGIVLGWAEPVPIDVPVFSRAQLLAHTWGFGTQGSWIVYAVCGVAALLWLVGVLLLTTGFAALGGFRQGIGLGFMLCGILLVYAVISPPFQGPDEADHFLTFAEVQGDKTLPAEALALAHTGHFERIKRRAEEIFASVDTLSAQKVDWVHYIAAPPRTRSPVATITWSTLGRIFPFADASIAMLMLRITNALWVGVCLTMALIVAARFFKQSDLLPWLAMPVLLVPSVAYFGTAVSNYPFLIGGYAIQAVALGLIWACFFAETFEIRPLFGASLLAGLGTAIGICSADNGLVGLIFWLIFMPVCCFAIGIKLAVNSIAIGSVLRITGIFLTAFFATFALVALLNGGQSLPQRVDEQVRALLPPTMPTVSLGFLLFLVYGIALLVSCLGAFYLSSVLRRTDWAMRGRSVWIFFASMAVVAILVLQAEPLPCLATSEIIPSLGGYMAKAVPAFIDGFGPGKADWLVVETFWGWFGWMDTVLPNWLIDLLRLSAGFGLVALLAACLTRSVFPSNAFLLAGSLAAVTASVASLAAFYHSGPVNLHARYLLGVYLFTLPLAAAGYRRVLALVFDSASHSRGVRMLLPMLAVLIQAVAWTTIINRYF